MQNNIDKTNYGKVIHNIPFIITAFLFCFIGVYFNFLLSKIYLVLLICMLFSRTLGFKVINNFDSLIGLVKDVKKTP